MVSIPNDGKGSPWTRSGGSAGLHSLRGLSEWRRIRRQLEETIPGKSDLCKCLSIDCLSQINSQSPI